MVDLETKKLQSLKFNQIVTLEALRKTRQINCTVVLSDHFAEQTFNRSVVSPDWEPLNHNCVRSPTSIRQESGGSSQRTFQADDASEATVWLACASKCLSSSSRSYTSAIAENGRTNRPEQNMALEKLDFKMFTNFHFKIYTRFSINKWVNGQTFGHCDARQAILAWSASIDDCHACALELKGTLFGYLKVRKTRDPSAEQSQRESGK